MEDNNNNAIVVQRDATTCAPLVGEPKSLISKGGKNVLDYNQEPPPEFVSDKNRLDCFAFARNDEIVGFEDNKILNQLTATPTHTDSHVSPQLNGSLCKVQNDNTAVVQNNAKDKTLTNLFPYFPISLSLKKKIAFTLAETLITLGIIGIVAAMTIPALITNYQKESTVTRLKKAIAVINQAYKQSFDDVGEPDSAFDMEAVEYFKQYWAPYIKVLTYCSNPQVCGYDSNNPFITPKNNSANTTLVSQLWRTTFYTMDGFLYIVMTAGGNPKRPAFDVLVDINGGAKPNRLGRDVFKLVRVPDGGGVQPYGYDRTTYDIDRICAESGWTCAEKIRRAGWKIEKDYPWK